MLLFFSLLAIHAGFAGSIPAAPENITLTFISPTSVKVSWQMGMDVQTYPIDKFDVTYKPTDARVVAVVAGNSEAVTLGGLSPDTQYQVTVAAIWGGKKYRSRPIVFRTLSETEDSPPRTSPQQDSNMSGNGPPVPPLAEASPPIIGNSGVVSVEYNTNSTNSTRRELPTIRGVEIGIVCLVLFVWAGAIALFFNRWGKIRMLLPYQPDYKQDQLKVPGTGVCATGQCNGQHSHQHMHHWPTLDEPSTAITERCQRARINSAIFVSSEGKGFDSIEFIRRYGSQSVLCRKAKSAENITSDRNRRFSSTNKEWDSEDKDPTKDSYKYNDSCNKSDIIELVECHNEPSSSVVKGPLNGNSRTPKLNTLPTLSVSGPSPPHEKEEFL